MKGGVRHDINKRRILRKKSDLLKTYGIYSLSVCYGMYVMYWFNKRLYPTEYSSEEE
jgi:hypothetical protein